MSDSPFNSTSAAKVNVSGLQASPSGPAASMPIVRGRCPACGMRTLFLASGGYVTCSSLSCGDPCRAGEMLEHGQA